MIEILQADLTTLEVDAIVNAANSALRGGGGVDGAIHRAAGRELLVELQRFSHCNPGSAVRTRGYRLPAKWVIHAVGPIWQGGNHAERGRLKATYESAFAQAKTDTNPGPPIRSIAFPAISTGVYRFPKELAAEIALGVMLREEQHFERIVACLFDEESRALYEATLSRRRAG